MSCLKPVSRNIKLLLLEAAYKADNARDTVDREFWLSRQSSWLHLATSYEYTERVSDFLQEVDALPKTPFCSIVTCLCGQYTFTAAAMDRMTVTYKISLL